MGFPGGARPISLERFKSVRLGLERRGSPLQARGRVRLGLPSHVPATRLYSPSRMHPTSWRTRVSSRSGPPLRPTAPNCGPVYRRRRPTQTPLYPLVQHHLETFLTEAAEADPMGGGVPSWVERDFRAYLRCGILAHGFARARCAGCGYDFLGRVSPRSSRVPDSERVFKMPIPTYGPPWSCSRYPDPSKGLLVCPILTKGDSLLVGK